jgi:hypothetical protein
LKDLNGNNFQKFDLAILPFRLILQMPG